ncbi:hypothetical protein TNCV_839631 [Trichonephila clavipes]|nr:hypothetical protein TNCV_839631 [Trichonephila clavipes]
MGWRLASRAICPVFAPKAQNGVLLAPCHDEFRGPRSDYVRQVALATTTTTFGTTLVGRDWTSLVCCATSRTRGMNSGKGWTRNEEP